MMTRSISSRIARTRMDTKFSVAVHLLVMISESGKPQSSEDMAKSVGTNPSYVRKILSLLKQGGIVYGRRGMPGHALVVPADQLTLLRIYQAVSHEEIPSVLDLHQNPSDKCIVGRYIRPVLSAMFFELENAFAQALSSRTLGDCVRDIRIEAEQEGESLTT